MPEIIRIILLLLIPPIGVFTKVGVNMTLFINIILTLLGYIPGLIHGIYIFTKK